MALVGSLFSCAEAAPQDIIIAVETIERDLRELRAAEFFPDDYAQFVRQWVGLKSRIQGNEDLIRWPWESNDLGLALRQFQEQGTLTVARLTKMREALRYSTESKIAQVEGQFQVMTQQVSAINSRFVLGQKLVETDLLMKQAHVFYEQAQYDRSLEAADRAAQNLATQLLILNHELGRYANPDRISRWQSMAKDAIAWSRSHHASAIVVSKADRILTLYQNGQAVLSYPVSLGFNGIREKRYQGDGATPEGQYRISNKRGLGQTQFYRALVLNYPNKEDQRRYRHELKAGLNPISLAIGGQIEIHGGANELMPQTLGCVMLDSSQMGLLFDRVVTGTPVTIVGALHERNSVAQALLILAMKREET